MPLQTLAIAAAALVAWTAQGQAAAITSTTSLIEGDLTFSHFGATVSKGDFGLTSPDMASQINVTKSDNGIEFSSGFMAYGVGAFDDVVLKYEVQTSNGTKISQIGLDFNGSIFGFAMAQVIETVKDQFGHMVGQLTVSCSLLGCDRQDPFLEWGDIPLNIGYTDLYVTKDIYVGAALGSASKHH